MTQKEIAKVTHDINNVWHLKFQGKKKCVIETHSYELDSPSYEYHFINNGFDDYTFVGKFPTSDRR